MSKIGFNAGLALRAALVTEKAAIAASSLAGHGDEKSADQAAVDAMRTDLNAMEIKGRVVIGEGERDEAPMLYIGEEVGKGKGPEIDIALDPLEGQPLQLRIWLMHWLLWLLHPEADYSTLLILIWIK